MAQGKIRLGMAGWVFAPWRGPFYPEGLVQKHELAHAATRVTMIEINATFRANQKPASFARWAGEVPEDFLFALKGPQAVTHFKRLKDVRAPLAAFFGSGVLALGERLGPIVWQLPPNLKFDADVLERFLALLPKSVAELEALAAEAPDAHLAGGGEGKIRHAIETRHESFADPKVRDMLGAHNVALVYTDTVADEDATPTADFVYCRLQGPPTGGGYGPQDLDGVADRLKDWAEAGRDVHAVFVHEDKLNAPLNAVAVLERLGLARRH